MFWSLPFKFETQKHKIIYIILVMIFFELLVTNYFILMRNINLLKNVFFTTFTNKNYDVRVHMKIKHKRIKLLFSV